MSNLVNSIDRMRFLMVESKYDDRFLITESVWTMLDDIAKALLKSSDNIRVISNSIDASRFPNIIDGVYSSLRKQNYRFTTIEAVINGKNLGTIIRSGDKLAINNIKGALKETASTLNGFARNTMLPKAVREGLETEVRNLDEQIGLLDDVEKQLAKSGDDVVTPLTKQTDDVTKQVDDASSGKTEKQLKQSGKFFSTAEDRIRLSTWSNNFLKGPIHVTFKGYTTIMDFFRKIKGKTLTRQQFYSNVDGKYLKYSDDEIMNAKTEINNILTDGNRIEFDVYNLSGKQKSGSQVGFDDIDKAYEYYLNARKNEYLIMDIDLLKNGNRKLGRFSQTFKAVVGLFGDWGKRLDDAFEKIPELTNKLTGKLPIQNDNFNTIIKSSGFVVSETYKYSNKLKNVLSKLVLVLASWLAQIEMGKFVANNGISVFEDGSFSSELAKQKILSDKEKQKFSFGSVETTKDGLPYNKKSVEIIKNDNGTTTIKEGLSLVDILLKK